MKEIAKNYKYIRLFDAANLSITTSMSKFDEKSLLVASTASLVSLSSPIDDLSDLMHFNDEKDRSHEAVVTDNVSTICISFRIPETLRGKIASIALQSVSAEGLAC